MLGEGVISTPLFFFFLRRVFTVMYDLIPSLTSTFSNGGEKREC